MKVKKNNSAIIFILPEKNRLENIYHTKLAKKLIRRKIVKKKKWFKFWLVNIFYVLNDVEINSKLRLASFGGMNFFQ